MKNSSKILLVVGAITVIGAFGAIGSSAAEVPAAAPAAVTTATVEDPAVKAAREAVEHAFTLAAGIPTAANDDALVAAVAAWNVAKAAAPDSLMVEPTLVDSMAPDYVAAAPAPAPAPAAVVAPAPAAEVPAEAEAEAPAPVEFAAEIPQELMPVGLLNPVQANFVSAVDGDTAIFDTRAGQLTVNLIGIRAPEGCGADKAKAKLERLLGPTYGGKVATLSVLSETSAPPADGAVWRYVDTMRADFLDNYIKSWPSDDVVIPLKDMDDVSIGMFDEVLLWEHGNHDRLASVAWQHIVKRYGDKKFVSYACTPQNAPSESTYYDDDNDGENDGYVEHSDTNADGQFDTDTRHHYYSDGSNSSDHVNDFPSGDDGSSSSSGGGNVPGWACPTRWC